MNRLEKIIYYASQTEFRRFFWAGSFSFVVDFSILLVLTEVANVNYLWSNLAAVSAGLVVNYLLCIKWVFTDRRFERIAQEFPIFALLSLVGLSLNELLLWVLVEFGDVHYLVAKIIVTLAIFVVNFFLKKVILFRR